MMKNMILLSFSLVAGMLFGLQQATLANPITREQARQRAVEYLSDVKPVKELVPVTDSRRMAPRRSAAQVHEPYYVFDNGNDEGFVIVPGDDRTVPVLGYSDSGHFDYNDMPCGMKAWLEAYTAELNHLMQIPDTARSLRAPAKVYGDPLRFPAIPKLMKTTWGQGYPYNKNVPDGMPAGCVAIAMAQVMNYHRNACTDHILTDIPDWSSWKGVPGGTIIDWPNILDSYNNNSPEAAQVAVGNYVYACAAACTMAFGPNGSGSSGGPMMNGAKTYFGFDKTIRRCWRSAYTSAEWNELVYSLLSIGPIYAAGNGHAYVCDGYDGRGLYHMNWGWGGGSDGYYYIDKLTVGEPELDRWGYGFALGMYVVANFRPEIIPNKAIQFTNAAVGTLCVENFDADNDGKVTFSEAAAVNDIGTVFQGSRIAAFPELAYFTGISTISDDAFKGCALLTEIALPVSVRSIGNRAFSGCARLPQVTLPEGVTAIGDSAFAKCSKLIGLKLPETVKTIGHDAFKGCAAITDFELNMGLQSLGSSAFANCTKLKNFEVPMLHPERLTIGEEVFTGCKLTNATLYVGPHTRNYYAEDPQWQQFASIIDTRDLSGSEFVAPEDGKEYYIYNIGTGRYITRGEAWNTQAVAGHTPMKIKLFQKSGSDDIFGFACYDFNTEKPYLFRASDDSAVGNGVHTVFIDGDQNKMIERGYWRITPTETGTYTIQIPSGTSGYKAGQFCGLETTHKNNAYEDTYALYTDVAYEGNEEFCQWAFIPADTEMAMANTTFNRLRGLLILAKGRRGIDVSEETAVFENPESTVGEMLTACTSLCDKLGFLDLQELEVYKRVIDYWDLDLDRQISYVEAAKLESIDTTFKGLPAQNLNFLKNCREAVIINEEAFKGCDRLTDIILPPNTRSIGKDAFKGCSSLEKVVLSQYVAQIQRNAFDGCTNLKTVRIENTRPDEITVDPTAFRSLDLSSMTLEVPEGTREGYATANVWKNFGTIVEVHVKTMPAFSAPADGLEGYLYNIGSRRYLRAGELWGTQAVVAAEGYVYTLHKAGGDNTFYMDSQDVNRKNKTMFRATNDSKLGEVRACFTDGEVTPLYGYWYFEPVEGEENVYKLIPPKNNSLYVEGECCGILPTHAIGYETIDKLTYGLYWDVPYEGNELYCQWAFITKEDFEAAQRDDQVGVEQVTQEPTLDTVPPDAVYNLQGQRVTDSYRGVVIIGGKKYLK